MFWGSFLNYFGVILVSFLLILVLFWCPWGVFGDPGPPRGPPKGPSRKSDEKVGSWVLPGAPKIAQNRSINMLVRVVFSVPFFYGFGVPFLSNLK